MREALVPVGDGANMEDTQVTGVNIGSGPSKQSGKDSSGGGEGRRKKEIQRKGVQRETKREKNKRVKEV